MDTLLGRAAPGLSSLSTVADQRSLAPTLEQTATQELAEPPAYLICLNTRSPTCLLAEPVGPAAAVAAGLLVPAGRMAHSVRDTECTMLDLSRSRGLYSQIFWLITCGHSAPNSYCQLLDEDFGLLQNPGPEALSEPPVDRCEQIACFCVLPLLAPQPGEAHGGTQLP
jgi:hypothetical protein